MCWSPRVLLHSGRRMRRKGWSHTHTRHHFSACRLSTDVDIDTRLTVLSHAISDE